MTMAQFWSLVPLCGCYVLFTPCNKLQCLCSQSLRQQTAREHSSCKETWQVLRLLGAAPTPTVASSLSGYDKNICFSYFRFTIIVRRVSFTLARALYNEIVNLARNDLMLKSVQKPANISYICQWKVRLKICLVMTNSGHI